MFLVLLFSSCSLATTKGSIEQPLDIKVLHNPYFSDMNKDYVYKAKIEVYGNYFGGIMVFKKLNDQHHRMAFTTEFGAKIFDFEFKNQEFIKNYIVEKMDKKIVVNTLKKDFQLLLQEHHDVNAKFTRGKEILYRSDHDKKWKFAVVDSVSNHLKKIIYTHRFKEKITITFRNVTSNVAQEIELKHKSIQLSIDLKMIN